jgi:hypothetical protein
MPIFFLIVGHTHKYIRHNFNQSALWGTKPFSEVEADGEKTQRLKLRHYLIICLNFFVTKELLALFSFHLCILLNLAEIF